MGKELAGARPLVAVPKPRPLYQSKSKLQAELARLWSPANTASNQRVIEDGYAKVVLRGATADTNVIFKGLANEGNRFGLLPRLLKANGTIGKSAQVAAYFLRKGFVWELVDPGRDTFKSGDSIMLVTKGNCLVKKAIRPCRDGRKQETK